MSIEEQKRYINVLFDEATLSAIDDFRFENRIASRTEAIRRLVTTALGGTPRAAASVASRKCPKCKAPISTHPDVPHRCRA